MRSKTILPFMIKVFFFILVSILVIITFYPFCWMVLNSFKGNTEIFQRPLSLPKSWNFNVFKEAWDTYHIGKVAKNSLIVTIGVVFINFICSSLAAFATSHLQFKGKHLFLSFCIGCQVVSGQILLTPLFKLLKDLNLYNSHVGLILVMGAFSLPMSIYLFHGFFKEIPKDLYESAKIDSCSNFKYFIRILLPLSTPIIASVIIFQTMFAWNEFLFSMTFLRDADLWTIPPLLKNLFSGKRQNYGLQFASLSITVVPILMLYIGLQKYFIKGLTAGAVKG